MNLRSLRRWQWLAIGSVLGLLVGWGWLATDDDQPWGGKGFIRQVDFEDELIAPTTSIGPILSDVVIHPSRANGLIDLVTMTRLDVQSQQFREYRFAAPRPYLVGRKSTSSKPGVTVKDYLSAVAAEHPAVSFREAWWEARWFVLGFGWLAGGIVVGEICPTLIRLSLPRELPVPKLRDAARTVQDAVKFHDPELELSSELPPVVGASDVAASQPQSPKTAPVTILSAAPLEATAAAPPGPSAEYEGEFYPVEKHRSHGFTLIELLVVIGIIAILASLVMPIARVVRTHAQATQCASQLHQVGMALFMYANANGGWLPAWSGWNTWHLAGDGTPVATEGPAWTVELIPYIGNPDSPIYNCPSFPGPMRCRNYFLESQWSGRSGRNAMKLSDIALGGRFVLSGDKTNMALYPNGSAEDSVLGDDTDPDDFGAAGMLLWPWNGGIYMHRTGNNVLFDDLHVGFFSRYDPAAMTFNPHRMEAWEDVTPN